jgi:hypothetical protein
MSISEPFRYRNDSFQSDIFSSDIGITNVDVGCRISPILRSMSMPTNASTQGYLKAPRQFMKKSVKNCQPEWVQETWFMWVLAVFGNCF